MLIMEKQLAFLISTHEEFLYESPLMLTWGVNRYEDEKTGKYHMI